MVQKQTGFTLIEIAIVLVIIGLLLGGVLKGQELITSARVRNLISQQDGVKAAFFGFQDRFRAFPGDYTGATANISGVATAACNGGNGDGDGRIETANNEYILAWEHMSKAGFIAGSYTCAASEGATTTPVNPYGMYLQVIYDGVYGGGSSPQRHNIKTGPQIPVGLMFQMDQKIDDGSPNTGTFQFSTFAAQGTAPTGGSGTACTSATAASGAWNTTNGNTNCGGASLL
ncbi:MAG: prepilin-type N-terminal cleavage/methylation domain-containing protein [Betaproteobacteria bacterium]|nr:MAG: prepilin-type N-terminal cleavage/methylation domain-containing protein [Betaproteobacteria bacterium]